MRQLGLASMLLGIALGCGVEVYRWNEVATANLPSTVSPGVFHPDPPGGIDWAGALWRQNRIVHPDGREVLFDDPRLVISVHRPTRTLGGLPVHDVELRCETPLPDGGCYGGWTEVPRRK